MLQRTEKKIGKRSQAASAKRQLILTAALAVFSQYGIHGARLEQVAERAGVSKTNLLYYYPSKEALYVAVMRQILDVWLAPLKAFRAEFSPLEAIKEYIRLKLEVSRDYPQASRLFCMEMLAGAPLLMDELTGDLKALIDEKSALIAGWVHCGKLAPVSPHHLIFMIWATTQHYADFAPQVEAVTGATLHDDAFSTKRSKAFSALLLKGFGCVNRKAAVGSSNHPLHIATARLKTLRVRSFYRSGTGWRSWVERCRPPYLNESARNRRPAGQSMQPALFVTARAAAVAHA